LQTERGRSIVRQRARGLTALALVALALFLTWRATTLRGLPDIGDPFDVAAFADREIADGDNAYVLYKQAVARLTKEPAGITSSWATSGPAERAWLEASREAMAIWRRGTEKAEARALSPRTITIETSSPFIQDLRYFMRLARLEGSRLEALGDLAGAWGWYRAILRTSRHLGPRATMIERFVGMHFHRIACDRLTRWAADPRVDAPMLRRALDAAIADYAETCPLSDNLKAEYLAFAHTYDDPERMRRCLDFPEASGLSRASAIERDPTLFKLRRIVKHEPERSRRVLRLIFANLLAWSDLPRDRRPPIAASITNPDPTSKVKILLDLRAVPGPVPPGEVVRWFDSSYYGRLLMPAFAQLDTAFDGERSTQARLVVTLASRLHEVERGRPPETAGELVGPYLKDLPDGYAPPR